MADLANIELTRIDGSADRLAHHDGRVLLIVNVASKCGLTAQYDGLEALYRKYRDSGFEVLGFPANDFGAQEPGSDEEIAGFCATTYDVSFPLFSKADVTGPEKQPLYAALTQAHPEKEGDAAAFRERQRSRGRTPTEDPEILWNFEKFLLGRTGKVVGRFAPTVTPDDPGLVQAIERELASA
ncbi:MAG TPA: glutathione peroxidase [Sphingobium sp.]